MSGQFTLDVARWVEKAKGNATLAVRALALEILRRVVMRSPVGNPDLWKNKPPAGYVGGRFRANWQLTIHDPATSIVTRTDADGTQTVLDGAARLEFFQAGWPIYIVNNLPYAMRLEFEGWSSQAPAGMLRITLAEVQGLLDDAVRDLSNR